MSQDVAMDLIEKFRPFNDCDWSDHRIYMVLTFAEEICGLQLEMLLIAPEWLFQQEMRAILKNYNAEAGAFDGGYWPHHSTRCGQGCQQCQHT